MSEQTVLFDLDGTLLNTPHLILCAYQNVLDSFDVPFELETVRRTIGRPLNDSFRELIPEFGHQQIDQCVQSFRIKFRELSTEQGENLMFPQALSLLKKLKKEKWKIAAVTSKVKNSAEEVLSLAKARQFFDELFCTDMVANGKPAPDLALLALATLGVLPPQTTVVGDTMDDVNMANGAGVKCIGVTWGVTSKQDFAKHGYHELVSDWQCLSTRLDERKQ